jgi:hypothetical protein
LGIAGDWHGFPFVAAAFCSVITNETLFRCIRNRHLQVQHKEGTTSEAH